MSVVAGQSGVGKLSLLNVIDPELQLRVQPVSEENEKGKHTTTNARLLPDQRRRIRDRHARHGPASFSFGTSAAEEVVGYYRDLRPYVSLCRYPDCTHTHEGHPRPSRTPWPTAGSTSGGMRAIVT